MINHLVNVYLAWVHRLPSWLALIFVCTASAMIGSQVTLLVVDSKRRHDSARERHYKGRYRARHASADWAESTHAWLKRMADATTQDMLAGEILDAEHLAVVKEMPLWFPDTTDDQPKLA